MQRLTLVIVSRAQSPVGVGSSRSAPWTPRSRPTQLRQGSWIALLGSLAIALSACHEAAPAAPPAAPANAPAAAPAPAAASGRLKRAEVDQVLVQQGPPWVLRRVMSEEVIARDGKFAGWRLVGLPEEWRAIDLKPGDVVTRVNGLPLETPDQAFEAWKSVAKFPEIKIAVVRDGAAREVSIPIDGAPSGETLKLFGREPPAQRVSAPAPRRGSVQLGGAAATPDEESY